MRKDSIIYLKRDIVDYEQHFEMYPPASLFFLLRAEERLVRNYYQSHSDCRGDKIIKLISDFYEKMRITYFGGAK